MDIYKITDKSTNMVYIGRTNRAIRFRLSEHKYKKSLIGKAIKQKGLDNFLVEIIDHADSYDGGRRLEKKWIEYYNCFFPNGYNVADGDSRYGKSNSFYGRNHSEEAIRANITHQKGRKAVIDYDTGIKYPSIRFCARVLGLTKTQIARLCNGLCPNSKYHLAFVKE